VASEMEIRPTSKLPQKYQNSEKSFTIAGRYQITPTMLWVSKTSDSCNFVLRSKFMAWSDFALYILWHPAYGKKLQNMAFLLGSRNLSHFCTKAIYTHMIYQDSDDNER